MAGRQTTLCIVNTTGMDITDIDVSLKQKSDWIGDHRPDRNFQGANIAKFDSLCELEELKANAKFGGFRMTLRFTDGSDLIISNDQINANMKYNRPCPDVRGSATDQYFIFQKSGRGINALYVMAKQKPDNASWMGELLDRKPGIKLNQITMPGSHDSGMYTTRFRFGIVCRSWIRTQSGNINQQLEWGSRYFDLRVYDTGSHLCIGHFDKVGCLNLGRYGPKLSDILGQVKTFIQSEAGQSESVILKFSHTMDASPRKKSVDEVVTEVVKQVEEILGGNLFILQDSGINLAEIPLSELAGKVVVVYDVEYQAHCTTDTRIFTYRDHGFVGSDHGFVGLPGNLWVYDQYADTNSFINMKNDQAKKLSEFGGYDHEYLFLLSWTLTRIGICHINDIRTLSNLANPRLPQILSEIRGGKYKRPNIVYYDFIDPYLNQAIINLNFD